MPKWKTDAVEFDVDVAWRKKVLRQGCRKPILEKIGNPEKLRFILEKSGKITLEAAKSIEPLVGP